ncbi:hypothetical protein [Streptomyces sp. NPDC093261]
MALHFDTREFVDFENDALEDIGGTDLGSMSPVETSAGGPQA